MPMVTQEEVGRCSLIDVLEEAVLRRRPIAVRLSSGASFIDQLVDVVTERGEDYAVFRDHERVGVTDISAVTRAEPNRE
jgi:Rho-binding antiterminator